MRIRLSVLLALFLTMGSLSAEETKEDLFLLPYFLGNGETGVYFACSDDGLNFEWLNDGKVIMPAPPWGLSLIHI